MKPGHPRVSHRRASRYGGQGGASEPRERRGAWGPRERRGAWGPREQACKGARGTKSPGGK
jgi:hypothetical protein